MVKKKNNIFIICVSIYYNIYIYNINKAYMMVNKYF